MENKISIAVFMGAKVEIWEGINQPYFKGIDPRGWTCGSNSQERCLQNVVNSCRYDSDWSWLMQVVEKIENLGASIEINNKVCIIEPTPIFNFDFHFSKLEKTKMEAVYNACVDFTKWYNKNNQ